MYGVTTRRTAFVERFGEAQKSMPPRLNTYRTTRSKTGIRLAGKVIDLQVRHIKSARGWLPTSYKLCTDRRTHPRSASGWTEVQKLRSVLYPIIETQIPSDEAETLPRQASHQHRHPSTWRMTPRVRVDRLSDFDRHPFAPPLL